MPGRRRISRPLPARVAPRHAGVGPNQKRLFRGTDHGRSVTLDPELFAPAQRGGGWGPFAESFLRLNENAIAKLDASPEVSSSEGGVRLSLVPGGRTGAIPLRSAQTVTLVQAFLSSLGLDGPASGAFSLRLDGRCSQTSWKGLLFQEAGGKYRPGC